MLTISCSQRRHCHCFWFHKCMIHGIAKTTRKSTSISLKSSVFIHLCQNILASTQSLAALFDHLSSARYVTMNTFSTTALNERILSFLDHNFQLILKELWKDNSLWLNQMLKYERIITSNDYDSTFKKVYSQHWCLRAVHSLLVRVEILFRTLIKVIHQVHVVTVIDQTL